jgi:hypothetical protein
LARADTKEDVMGFVQMIEFRTSQIEQLRAAGNEAMQTSQATSKAPPVLVTADRDNPGRRQAWRPRPSACR